jgi:hypothetical protein
MGQKLILLLVVRHKVAEKNDCKAFSICRYFVLPYHVWLIGNNAKCYFVIT